MTVSVKFTSSQKNSIYIGRVANNVFENFRLSVYCVLKFLPSDCSALHSMPTAQISLWYFRSPTVSLCRKRLFWPRLHADPHIWGSRQEVHHSELPPGYSATHNAQWRVAHSDALKQVTDHEAVLDKYTYPNIFIPSNKFYNSAPIQYLSQSIQCFPFEISDSNEITQLLLLLLLRPVSRVGVAIDYGLEGPGSKIDGDEIFCPSKPALGPTQPSAKWILGLSRA